MGKEREVGVSRRLFAKTAGAAAAVAASVGTAVAQPVRPAVMRARPTMARQTGLAKLSNALYNSPAERKVFLADPAGYAGRKGVQDVNQADLAQIKNMIADGFCCSGCGCSGVVPGETIQQ